MLSKENEYIVKAKDLNIEIKSVLKDKIKIVLTIVIILYFVLLFWKLEPFSSKSSNIEIFVFHTVIYVMFNLLIFVNFDWKLKINDRKLYVDIPMKHYVIEYSNLINIKYCLGYRNRYILIQYLENEQIKRIELASTNIEYSKWKEICKMFITNKDLESGIQPEDDYFCVRDENPLKENIQKERMSFNNIFGLLFIVGFISFLMIKLLLTIFFKLI